MIVVKLEPKIYFIELGFVMLDKLIKSISKVNDSLVSFSLEIEGIRRIRAENRPIIPVVYSIKDHHIR